MTNSINYFKHSFEQLKCLCVALFFRYTCHVILVICMMSETSQAQETTISKKFNTTDTSRILELINKGKQLTDKLPREALQNISSALQESKAIQYPKGIALASAAMGRWYFGNDVGKSIQLGSEALNSFEKNEWGTIDNIADMHLLLAEAYDEQGIKDSSAYYYYILGSEMDVGNISNPEFAIMVFTKLTIFWVNLDYGGVVNEEYSKTVKRFVEKARQASLQIKDSANASSSLYFIQGASHHGLKEYDSARYYYTLYITEREKLNKLNITRKISTLFNIADTYLQENKPAEALKYINEVKEIGKNPQNTKYLAFYISFIDLLTAKAYFQQKQYQATIDILNKTFEDLKLTGTHFRNEVVESYQIYADSYEALGNYQKALEYKNTYIKLYDSLTKKDKIDMISRLEIRNRMAEKDKELALQKLTLSEVSNKVRDKNFWIGGISLLALSGVLIFGLWRKKNIDKQKLQQESINNLQQKIKIERLKASISGEERERTRIGRELHDGIGGLLSVARMNFELAKKNKNNETNEDFLDGLKLLEEATVELRKAAYNLMPEVLLNQGLASAVQAFCEKMMSKSTTTIDFQAIGNRPDVTSSFDLPIYRIIQELVHNIIKHANANHALVQLNFQENGTLDITIEDNGIGLPEDAFEKLLSMGLKNIKERVNDLGGKLDIQSSPESGTSIYLEFESFQENINTI
jgi:two-component system, NarL family, sensor kinase